MAATTPEGREAARKRSLQYRIRKQVNSELPDSLFRNEVNAQNLHLVLSELRAKVAPKMLKEAFRGLLHLMKEHDPKAIQQTLQMYELIANGGINVTQVNTNQAVAPTTIERAYSIDQIIRQLDQGPAVKEIAAPETVDIEANAESVGYPEPVSIE